MRLYVLALTALLCSLLTSPSVHALTITYDFSSPPASTDFHAVSAASTEISGVTLSATLFGGTAFNTSGGGLGASGIGSASSFDGEGGFSFSFDAPGTLTSITLNTSGISYDLITPNDGTDTHTTSFSGADYSFLTGEVFTFDHNGGGYRVQTIVIELAAAAVPEPQTVSLAILGLIGLGWFRWRRR